MHAAGPCPACMPLRCSSGTGGAGALGVAGNTGSKCRREARRFCPALPCHRPAPPRYAGAKKLGLGVGEAAFFDTVKVSVSCWLGGGRLHACFRWRCSCCGGRAWSRRLACCLRCCLVCPPRPATAEVTPLRPGTPACAGGQCRQGCGRRRCSGHQPAPGESRSVLLPGHVLATARLGGLPMRSPCGSRAARAPRPPNLPLATTACNPVLPPRSWMPAR